MDPLRNSGILQPVIKLQNVSVRYRVPGENFVSFKDYAIQWIQHKVTYHDFWALNNVSLDIPRQEVFGLIGKNGAGKSTLLKLVARVLQPQKGRVLVRGTVVPLLEIGAGFHPELTGRENIYLNASILGYTRGEITELVDPIIEFSELGEFIDSPLRTYSSGMWARLGFAVATVEKPDILIVDEILTVGDESFQKKCLARINRFRSEGTTILIVSHTMSTIEALCDRVAWLDHGNLKVVGDPKIVIAEYRSGKRLEVGLAGD